MATAPSYKAIVTTEIRIPLNKIPEENVSMAVGKDERYLRKIEAGLNVRIEWDKKGTAIYIHGEPKAAKHAYTKIMEQMSMISSTKGTTTTSEVAVNLLGKEFTDGVLFRKLHDATTKNDDGNSLQDSRIDFNTGGKNTPNAFVLNPTIMTHIERERGKIIAGELWRDAHFVKWDFKESVIRDASMVLRTQLKWLPMGQGKYLKLEMNIGKVVFNENNKNKYPLGRTKFAISEFRHLRFTKEITSTFRKEWDVSWTTHLRAILPMLGYDRDGNTLKMVKIYHTSQWDGGKFCKNVWSADILEGRRLGDKKPGALEFLKARVCEINPFSATVYNPAASFDFRFSIIINARESPENAQEIEERIRRGYRYSLKRGLLVNNVFENCSGYKPLVFPKARLIRETTWIRGDIKIFILEIQDGRNSTFEVKAQSNLLKKYIREDSGKTPLTDIIEALTELFEAVEEINGELNVLEAELSAESFSEPTGVPESNRKSQTGTVDKSVPSYDLYHTQKTDRVSVPGHQLPAQMDKFMVMATSAGITVKNGLNNKSLFKVSPPNEDEALTPPRYTAESSQKKTDFGTQPRKLLKSPGLPDSPTIGISGTDILWEGQVLTPNRKASQDPSPKTDNILHKQAKFPTTDTSRNRDSPITNKKVEHNTADITQIPVLIPTYLRPVTKALGPTTTPSPSDTSPTAQASPSYNISGRFLDLLDSGTDGDPNPPVDVLAPRRVTRPRLVKMKIDFFGSVEPSMDSDDGDLMSWSPDKNGFTYAHESYFELEGGEGISLLLD